MQICKGVWKMSGVLYGRGRTRTVVNQGSISAIYRLPENEFQQRRAAMSENCKYPLIDPKQLDVRQGHVACVIGVPEDSGPNNGLGLAVHTVANGLDAKSTEIRPVGVVLKGASATEDKDNGVTVQTAGKASVAYNSSKPANAGDLIMVCFPEYVQDLTGGYVPKINFDKEEHAGAFLWGLKPLREEDVYATLSGITRELQEKLLTPTLTEADVVAMVNKYSPEKDLGNADPIRRFIFYVLLTWVAHQSGSTLTETQRLAYIQNIGFQSENSDLFCTLDGSVSDVRASKRRRGALITQPGPPVAATDKYQRLACFSAEIFAELMKLYRKRIIGRALNNAVPGQQLDLMLGDHFF
jgi:hypothetical protein